MRWAAVAIMWLSVGAGVIGTAHIQSGAVTVAVAVALAIGAASATGTVAREDPSTFEDGNDAK